MRKLWESVVIGVTLLLITGGVLPHLQPQRRLSPEEVWKILYPQGVPVKVVEADLPNFVHWALLEKVQERGIRLRVFKWADKNPMGLRCGLVVLMLGTHEVFFWGGAMPFPDSVEAIQQASYTLWKVKGVRTSPNGVVGNEKGEITNLAAQVGDLFLKVVNFPEASLYQEYMLACVVNLSGDKGLRSRQFFPIGGPAAVSYGKGKKPTSWEDLLRYTYWEAITQQIVFASELYMVEKKGAWPKSRQDLTSVVGEEIKEHWTPAVATFVDYLLKRME